MNGKTLRYGIIGGGFISEFQLRSLVSVRGVEVAGLFSRSPPERLAKFVRDNGLGAGTIYKSIGELARNCDVLAFFGPNFTRVPALEEAAQAVASGANLTGSIIEKPLARNLAEADRVMALAKQIGAPTAYFENQIHMKSVQGALRQLRGVIDAMGPLALARSAEEHAGPHNAWFWDPTQQGGGVLSDMGCHSIALSWYALTPPGKSPTFLVPQSVNAQVALLKWGLPRYRDELRAKHGVDYAKTPAEDFATGIVTYPESGNRPARAGSVHRVVDVRQAGPAAAARRSRPRLCARSEQPAFAARDLHRRCGRGGRRGCRTRARKIDGEPGLARGAAERTRSVRLRRREPRRGAGVHEQASARCSTGTTAVEIVRLTMAAYLSAEEGRTIDLTDPATDKRLATYVPAIQQGRGGAQLLGAGKR